MDVTPVHELLTHDLISQFARPSSTHIQFTYPRDNQACVLGIGVRSGFWVWGISCGCVCVMGV